MRYEYSEENKIKIIEYICQLIENGEALRNVIKDTQFKLYVKELTGKDTEFSISTFFIWINETENLSKRYARAKEFQCESLFLEIVDIANDKTNDTFLDESGKTIINHANVNRDRLRVDALKWSLSKLYPKKYGDSLNIESKNENINENKVQTIKIVRINKDEVKE